MAARRRSSHSSPVPENSLAEPVAAQPDAEHQPAAAEPVQRRGLPRDLGRPPARQRRDHGTEQEPFGDGCRGSGQRDPRVGHLADGRAPMQRGPIRTGRASPPPRPRRRAGRPRRGRRARRTGATTARSAWARRSGRPGGSRGVPVSVQNMGTTSPDLYLAVDRPGRAGCARRSRPSIRTAVRGGRLPAGTRLPSTRALAADLGVTRRGRRGGLRPAGRRGVPVRPAGRPGDRASDAVPRPRRGGAGGRGGAGRSSSTSGRDAPIPRCSPVRPGPGPPARRSPGWGRPSWTAPTGAAYRRCARALAEYLGRVRGVDAHPDRIVACAELRARRRPRWYAVPAGATRFAVEEPGYPVPAQPPAAATGAGSIRSPVDGDGLVVDALRRTAARAVVVTPAHQSPTGVVLTPAAAATRWWRGPGTSTAYIIEDDFDAEFRYDRRPVGALQGLAPERVVYCGTTAKTLATGLRLGLAGAPGGAGRTDVAAAGRSPTGRRRRCCRRRFARAAARAATSTGTCGAAGGCTGCAATRVVAAVRRSAAAGDGRRHRRRVERRADPSRRHRRAGGGRARRRSTGCGVYPRRWFAADPGSARPGLVLGYGAVPPEQAGWGVRVLGEVVAGA